MMQRIHTTARLLKNPYNFYDLQRVHRPLANSVSETPKFPQQNRSFDPLASQSQESMKERMSKVFGELGSREQSRQEALAKGITVAGIHVPARPEEPTNCCMSGCVNCVWDLYKDEIDEYKHLRAEARKRLTRPEFNHVKWPPQLGPEPANRQAAAAEGKHVEIEDDDVDDGLNTGLKAFIETERKIKARREAQQQQLQQQQQQQRSPSS